MKNLETIQKLRNNVSQIRTLFKEKIKLWAEDEKYYDKTGLGFNLDNRFSACSKIEIWFSSWKGVYGDSGCSSQLDLDAEIFKNHLLKYLNLNKEEIMLKIADSIELEAKSLKDNAEEELNSQLKKLSELDDVKN